MIDALAATLVTLQIVFGATDTLLHHEGTERLAWRPSQARELRLHGVRNLFYAAIFLLIGWFEPKGFFAGALIVALGLEIIITLMDFIEEDRSRKLPASERVLHTLLALNYGAILVLILPDVLAALKAPSALAPAHYGAFSFIATFAGFGAALFGLRDLAAAARAPRLTRANPARLAAGLKARSRILVTGATGFIGRRLVEALVAAGHDVTALTRDAAKAASLPAPIRIVTAPDQIGPDERLDAIVHLAGEPISNGLWTEEKKRRVVDSRVEINRALVALASRLERKPAVYIAASAIGWYGLRGREPLTEKDAAEPRSFSHESCEAVETAARLMEIEGVRTLRLRIGLVLGVEGGLLARLLLPFEFGMGGPIGDGRQMMSWIHRDDLVRLIVYLMRNPALAGPVNATAPHPVDNAAFAKALGRALDRPSILPLPAAPLRLAFGDFAEELLLSGQNILPAKAQEAGFVFEYPGLDAALAGILGGGQERSAPQLIDEAEATI